MSSVAEYRPTSDVERDMTGDDRARDGSSPSSHRLLVMPHERRDGFWASIRGHVLDLAEPGDSDDVAPKPDDLYVASIASELAWSTRDLLRDHDLPDDVSVSAEWRTLANPPGVAELALTITVSTRAEPIRARLADSLESSLAARSPIKMALYITLEGAIR